MALSAVSPEKTADQTYREVLQGLSEGSVNKHFDPYVDIDWDSPDYGIDRNDRRWILPEADPLGRHPGTNRCLSRSRSRWGCGGRPGSRRWGSTSSNC